MGINNCSFLFSAPSIPWPGLLRSPVPFQTFHPLRTLICSLPTIFSQVPLTMITSGPWPILIQTLCSSASTSADRKHWIVSSRRWEPGEAGNWEVGRQETTFLTQHKPSAGECVKLSSSRPPFPGNQFSELGRASGGNGEAEGEVLTRFLSHPPHLLGRGSPTWRG